MALSNLANAINSVGGAGSAGGIGPTDKLGKANGGNAPNSPSGADFRNALGDALAGTSNAPDSKIGTKLGQIAAQMPAGGARVQPGSSLKFSNHSLERMHSRGITYSADQMKSIETAVAKAAAKGSKDTLVLTDNSALIVSVKNGTVVTVMDRAAMKENVFTNIDSTVMA